MHSARFLGAGATYAARFAEILHRLEGVPDVRRSARFVCALAVAEGGRILFEARGVVEGRIAHAPAGDGGFGYDPIFLYEGRSFAALPPEEKDAVSHRGIALRKIAELLKQETTNIL